MTLKRALRSVLALTLALCFVLLCACSTPKVAMTVGGKEYTMGDYLAYAWATTASAQQSDYTLMYMLYSYGAEALDISTDITVLDNMMAREGLVEDLIHRTESKESFAAEQEEDNGGITLEL